MKRLLSAQLWAVHSPLGHKPSTYPVDVYVVENNGRKYLHTPYAFLDWYGDDVTEEAIIRQAGRGYHVTQEDALAYIDRTYPFRDWPANETIHDRLASAVHFRGTLVGPGLIGDAIGAACMGSGDVYAYARGRIQATPEQAELALSCKI